MDHFLDKSGLQSQMAQHSPDAAGSALLSIMAEVPDMEVSVNTAPPAQHRVDSTGSCSSPYPYHYSLSGEGCSSSDAAE